MRQEKGHAQGGSRFPETSWALVLATRVDADAGGALETLCRRYWAPVYASVRRQGFVPEDAEDLTQAFFLHLLEHRTLARADPDRGRFRSFLLGALRWFLANTRERENARKRGGTHKFVAIDIADIESTLRDGDADAASFELQFDREWARTLVANALAALRGEYAGNGQSDTWDILQGCLDPGSETPSYAALATRLGSGEGAAKVAVHRLRRRFREALREEVGNTVATAQEVEEELRYLRDVLAAQPVTAGAG
ncbi:MAG: hypothetical protein OJF55_000162 [Rhodanobacteraceae bacterium]|nr:MAG: hypothetical protein OJF55_000162 [Rhodanobacteraceae bacterium]